MKNQPLERLAASARVPLRQAAEFLHFGQMRSPAHELLKGFWQERQIRILASGLSTGAGFLMLMHCSVSSGNRNDRRKPVSADFEGGFAGGQNQRRPVQGSGDPVAGGNVTSRKLPASLPKRHRSFPSARPHRQNSTGT